MIMNDLTSPDVRRNYKVVSEKGKNGVSMDAQSNLDNRDIIPVVVFSLIV